MILFANPLSTLYSLLRVYSHLLTISYHSRFPAGVSLSQYQYRMNIASTASYGS